MAFQGRNLTIEVKGRKMIIEVNLDGNTWAPSSNPRSPNKMLASTSGNAPITTDDGVVVYVGVNAYIKGS